MGHPYFIGDWIPENKLSHTGHLEMRKGISQENLQTCRTGASHGKVKHFTGAVSSLSGVNMQIALVIGSTISTIKDEAIRGRKLLIVHKADTAGTGDRVLITDGSSARFTSQTNNVPVDAVIVGVIDSLELGGEVTYRKK